MRRLLRGLFTILSHGCLRGQFLTAADGPLLPPGLSPTQRRPILIAFNSSRSRGQSETTQVSEACR
jgi:hypothetical protein